MSNKSTIVRTIQFAAPIASAVAPGLAARWLERLFTTPMRWPAPPREAPWIADAERSAVRFDADRSMPLLIWGEGPTVLLVHGWAGRGSQMAVYAAPLVRRGFRVVAFDAPAHGRADGERTALPEFAWAVERVAEAVGPLHAVVAHSLGAAATTIAFAGGLSAGRAVFIAPPERPVGYLDRAASTLGFSPLVARRTQRRLERRFGLKFDEAHGSTLARSLRIPLLAIHDEQDAEVPYAEGRRLTDAWPGARLMTVHGLGHRRILRDDGVVDAVVDFVAGDGSRLRPENGSAARE